MQVFKKILLSTILLLLSISSIKAQDTNTPGDTTNIYQSFISELENNGIDMAEMLKNEAFLSKLKEEGYNPDSLAYYYQLKYPLIQSDTSSTEQGFLSLISKAYGDSIVLRWAPSTLSLWRNLNKYGYMVIRSSLPTITDTVPIIDTIGSITRVYLADTLHPVRPWSLDRIANQIAPTDTAAMIAAQALYGEAYEDPASETNLDFVTRNNQLNMQFGFALLAADRSALAAELMGLRFVDNGVELGERYIYYVVSADTSGSIPFMASMSVIENNPAQNSKVEQLSTKAGDGVVTLRWPKAENEFSGYWIERSVDKGETWQKLTSDIVVFMENDNPGLRTRVDNLMLRAEEDPTEGAADYYQFVDSTANDINYQYRVSGQTPFGDFSDYTLVSAVSTDLTPPPPPVITAHEVDEESRIASLSWQMDYEAELLTDLASFSVWESSHPDSTYVQVSPNLPKQARSYTSETPLEKGRIHYYILKAVDNKGNETSSFPMYMHVIDDEAPAAPQRPSYLIDSTGVVTLVWEQNKEVDLLGYRVYFANDKSHELTQLTNAPIYVNLFRDTITLVTLTEKIYYRIEAVDLSHNRSAYSDFIEVQKPDFIPPVAPILHYPEMNDSIVHLQWDLSSSTDVIRHILYRRLSPSDDEWEVLQEFTAFERSFTDTSTQAEQFYQYTMRAQDDAGLFSDYAFPVKARRWFGGESGTIENLQIAYDSSAQAVNLNWQFAPPADDILKDQDYLFYVYRSLGDSPMLRYRILDRQTTSFSDLKVQKEGQYNYAVKVVFTNGKSGPMTEQKSVAVKEKRE
ncbi:MAG: hypothetical protein DHS20C18_50770 [Saprospiraceae bacterium]|nr:MAG: hypothetical protein DHS20C18_50770 [Saprospiraceae bacterium]